LGLSRCRCLQRICRGSPACWRAAKWRGDFVGPRIGEFPPPRSDGDLHTVERCDLGSAAWHRRTSGTPFLMLQRHPDVLGVLMRSWCSYEIERRTCALGSAAGGCSVPVAAKTTLRAPFRTAAPPPMALVSGPGLPLIGFVTLPNSAAHEYPPRAPSGTPARLWSRQRRHHNAAARVGNRRRCSLQRMTMFFYCMTDVSKTLVAPRTLRRTGSAKFISA
jgi:hypothetical protein